MLTDSHCHLASTRFDKTEIAPLIQRARDAGVGRLVTLATSYGDVQANLDIAADPAVHATLGIHPCEAHQASGATVGQLLHLAEDPRVCAIGETGLDYYHPAPDGWDDERFRAHQRELLRLHFELAAAAGLNVVIHTRDREQHASFEDALAIYQGYHQRTRAVFHCFIGPWENAKRVLDLGGVVSFGGVVTFKSAREVRDTALKCPRGSFMIETDAPYLAPEPHRGMRNEPAYVLDTAAYLAALRGESLELLAADTSGAASDFFRFRPA